MLTTVDSCVPCSTLLDLLKAKQARYINLMILLTVKE